MLIANFMLVEDFLKKNPEAQKPMERWVGIAEAASWTDIMDMRRTLPTSDAIKGPNFTCFNIGGNKYRLITVVSYKRQEIVIRELLRHADYDKKY